MGFSARHSRSLGSKDQGPKEPNTGWRREVDREQLTVDLEQAIADRDQGIKDREQVNLDTEQGDFDRWRTTPQTESDVAVIRRRQTRLDRSQENLERPQEAIDEVQQHRDERQRIRARRKTRRARAGPIPTWSWRAERRRPSPGPKGGAPARRTVPGSGQSSRGLRRDSFAPSSMTVQRVNVFLGRHLVGTVVCTRVCTTTTGHTVSLLYRNDATNLNPPTQGHRANRWGVQSGVHQGCEGPAAREVGGKMVARRPFATVPPPPLSKVQAQPGPSYCAGVNRTERSTHSVAGEHNP